MYQLFKECHFYHYLWDKELRWLMAAKCITINGTKDLLFPVQVWEVVNYYITELHEE